MGFIQSCKVQDDSSTQSKDSSTHTRFKRQDSRKSNTQVRFKSCTAQVRFKEIHQSVRFKGIHDPGGSSLQLSNKAGTTQEDFIGSTTQEDFKESISQVDLVDFKGSTTQIDIQGPATKGPQIHVEPQESYTQEEFQDICYSEEFMESTTLQERASWKAYWNSWDPPIR
jgi:hypothetical protein